MKKILTCFFLIVFGTSAAMADDAVTISRAIPSLKAPVSADASAAPSPARTTVARVAIPKNPVTNTDTDPASVVTPDDVIAPAVRTAARTVTQPSGTAAVPSRAVSRVMGATSDKVNSPRPSSAARGSAGTSRSVVAGDNQQRNNLETAVQTVGRNARVSAAGINSSAAVRRAGITLRPSTAEVGGRAIIGDTGIQTGSNIATEARSVQSRAAAQTKETIAAAQERLKQTADLNKSCQEQYNDCMDQFCGVIDANQKRCSCSSNLARYTKVEAAVKDANVQLNEVAQRIRYVGLSADEIRAIMTATEAEDVLSGTKDNTESRNMLEEIENLIKNPTSVTSSNSGDSFSSMDMDLDFSSGDGADMFNLDFLSSSSSSFSNLRGTDLYNAAKKRCATVLGQCKSAGATSQQITGNYDLAIDKDCIAYEQGLAKMNETLKANVRSANQMLQKARLAVLQNKNQYDAKGCIAALNTCMADDMVCGADYTKCLDPTKKYIDENGKVVLGKNISDILAFMELYDNSTINAEFLKTAAGVTPSTDTCKKAPHNKGDCIVGYLLKKIGTGKTVTDGGLCRAVLDKCQRYTYDSSNVYNAYNDVVVNYVQRAMVNIQAAQQKIISDYASGCMVDIAACYNQQVSQVNSWSSTANIGSIYNVMRGACRNVALTCAYAVFAEDIKSCPTDASTDQETCIDSISEIFYQSLLCPDNSSYSSTAKDDTEKARYVNDRCKCDSNYNVLGKLCVKPCAAGSYRNPVSSQCDLCPIGTYSDDKDAQSCKPCPVGKTTSKKGSMSASECTDIKK